jgi:hypothetical protein
VVARDADDLIEAANRRQSPRVQARADFAEMPFCVRRGDWDGVVRAFRYGR